MLRLGITPEGQIGSHPDIIATLRPQKCARATVVLAPSGPGHQSTLPRFMRSMLGSHCRLSVRAFIGFRRLDVLYQGDVPSDMGVVRSAFILISTLTVPHFILEHLMNYKNNPCAIGTER